MTVGSLRKTMLIPTQRGHGLIIIKTNKTTPLIKPGKKYIPINGLHTNTPWFLGHVLKTNNRRSSPTLGTNGLLNTQTQMWSLVIR